MMNRKELEKYASDNSLPFSQVLGWYLTGLLMYLAERIGFNNCMVIIRPQSLDPSQDVHILEEGIAAYYVEDDTKSRESGFVPGCPYTRDFTARLLYHIQTEASREQIPLVIKVGTGIRTELVYDGMYFPLEIRIRRKKDFYPDKSIYNFFDPQIRMLPVRVYPKENQAADYIMEILEKLELINEMEDYLYLYRLAKDESVSARDICHALSEGVKEENNATWKSFEIFSGYLNSTYMKKKWKVLLRRHKLKSPEWEEMMELLIKFIEPLWASVTKGELFFGDWMPELGRYLD